MVGPGVLVRRVTRDPKTIASDTGWKVGQIGPKHAPVFKQTVPSRANWEWRCLETTGRAGTYVLLLQVSPAFGKWKAWLMTADGKGSARMLLRIEDQPGKSGLHVHADCDGTTAPGPASIDLPTRLPRHDARHRRRSAWTRSSFLRATAKILRIIIPNDQEDLFDDPRGSP